jgi:1,4-alpha-glucan branching enzyme
VQGEGYDRKKVYSYLRHTGKQKLLFVCNFNNAQEQKIDLNIPEGAWNAMGLDLKTQKLFKGKFNQKTELIIEPQKTVSLKISPNSVVIYEILEKK